MALAAEHDQLPVDIDRERLVDGCVALVNIPTPTGYERPTAQRVVDLLRERGVAAELDEIDAESANAWALVRARGTEAKPNTRVMLYSPLDTVTTGVPRDDEGLVADVVEGSLLAGADRYIDSTGEVLVSGLGAQNPKGHAACVLEAAAILAAQDELAGDVIVALGAGGMPTDPISRVGDDRRITGHGVGVEHLLRTLQDAQALPDAALVAKSGWFVQHEEVGLAWIEVTVRGTHTYVGARHRLQYRNPIVDASRIAIALEERFADASPRSLDTLEPQAMVSSLHAGWQRTAAFLPCSARLRCDIRLLPGEDASVALKVVESVIDGLRANDPELDATAEVKQEILGSRTPSDHPICAASRSSWQDIEGRRHVAPARQSGSTDANIIRNFGIPTARIGLPKVHVDGVELGFAEGMNTVSTTSMVTLTEHLVRTVNRFQRGARGSEGR